MRFQKPIRTGNWSEDFKAWQRWASEISQMVERINSARLDRAYKLATSVGIPRNGCALHNASIDDDMRGWCYQNPERLKVAKRARYLADQWVPYDLEHDLIYRYYPKG